MSKESFVPFLIDILKETNYEEVASIEKRNNEWTAVENKEPLKPFLEWFIDCITVDNCVTTDELAIYRDLRCNDKLVPDDELDQRLQQYFNHESLGVVSQLDTKFSIDVAQKELQSLKSLEDFLSAHEKRIDKDKKAKDELDPYIKSELQELEALNTKFNKALNKYGQAWDDLKSQLSEEHSSKEHGANKYLNMIYLNDKINQRLNEHLKNDFQEIKPTDGKLNLTPVDYYVVHQKISEIRNDIIYTTGELHGKELIINYLMSLEQHLISKNPEEISLQSIEKFLNEAPISKENMTETLSETLNDEIYWLLKIQIKDAKNNSSFLEDRYNRLSRIQTILSNKKILNDAVEFVIKRNKVVQDYQLGLLNEFYNNIESLAIQHEERMEGIKNYKRDDKVYSLDPNFQAMMKCLGIPKSDCMTFDLEITNLKKNYQTSFVNLEENLQLFQNNFNKRLNELKKMDNVLIDGPTREMFGHILNNYMKELRENSNKKKTIAGAFTKIRKKLEEAKARSGQKDCAWIKCLDNPVGFVRKVYEIELETERLKERVERAMNQQ